MSRNATFLPVRAQLKQISQGVPGNPTVVLVRGYLNGGAGKRRRQWLAALRRGGFEGVVLELEWDASSVLRFATNVVGYRDWRALKERAAAVGRDVLPRLLAARGERDVILVGASAGARIVYHCLRSEHLPRQIVQDAWLLGGALGRHAEKDWHSVVSGLSGKLVNVYAPQDVVLKTLYRAASRGAHACGTGPIECPHPRVVSVDATNLMGTRRLSLTTHGRYFRALAERARIDGRDAERHRMESRVA